jgi:NAD(P)-dependent dehydrogenase (short-subunit alcohol dehydrogenase family)
MTDRPLEGRTALITGAGRGLGKAMAEGLAAQGAKIALIDLEDDILAAARDALSPLARTSPTGNARRRPSTGPWKRSADSTS